MSSRMGQGGSMFRVMFPSSKIESLHSIKPRIEMNQIKNKKFNSFIIAPSLVRSNLNYFCMQQKKCQIYYSSEKSIVQRTHCSQSLICGTQKCVCTKNHTQQKRNKDKIRIQHMDICQPEECFQLQCAIDKQGEQCKRSA